MTARASHRKIALIGTAMPSLRYAPWDDPSWEIWAHASAGTLAKRVDRYFDLHPPAVYRERRKNSQLDYHGWLKRLQTPIYLQSKDPEIPASRRYPRERVQAEFPWPFGSQAAWMIALALTEGVQTLGLFGIHYAHESEYREQRANCELWVGIAWGRGVSWVIPEGCPVAREPVDRYGYDSHTPEKYAARKAIALQFKQAKHAAQAKPGLTASADPNFDPARLRPATADELQRIEETWHAHGQIHEPEGTPV